MSVLDIIHLIAPSSLTNSLAELTSFANCIDSINAMNEASAKHIQYLTDEQFRLKKEIRDRQDTSINYPIGSDTITIDDYKGQLRPIERSVEEIVDETEERTNDRDEKMIILAHMIGLANLNYIRKQVGKHMSKHMRLQYESYNLQKERYENCKKTFGFTKDDRTFIAEHKACNMNEKLEWTKLSFIRERICELIDTIDPDYEDDGIDEED